MQRPGRGLQACQPQGSCHEADPAGVVAQLLAKTRDADHHDDLSVTLHAVTISMVELGVADMAGITERHGKAESSTTAPTPFQVAHRGSRSRTQNSSPSRSASTKNGSSPVWPTSTRRAPSPISLATSPATVPLSGRRSRCNRSLDLLGLRAGCSHMLGASVDASARGNSFRCAVVATLHPQAQGRGPEGGSGVHITGIQGPRRDVRRRGVCRAPGAARSITPVAARRGGRSDRAT